MTGDDTSLPGRHPHRCLAEIHRLAVAALQLPTALDAGEREHRYREYLTRIDQTTRRKTPMTMQPIESDQWSDAAGNPAGGRTQATGLLISWQNGPLAIDGTRREPNGCFVETVIAAAMDRLEFYQRSKFASTYNADAIAHLGEALKTLHARTADREKRGVEGTHKQ